MRERAETAVSVPEPPTAAPSQAAPGLHARVLELQRSAGNAAVCGLLRSQARTLAREAGPDDEVVAEAKRMLTVNDRGPDSETALLRKFGKGRVPAPQKHVTMLAAGAPGYAFKYIGGSPAYLSIGDDFVPRLARGDVATLKVELAKVIAEVDGVDPAAAAAVAQPSAKEEVAPAPAAAPEPAGPRKKEGRNPPNGAFRQRFRQLLDKYAPGQEYKEGTSEFDDILSATAVKGAREGKAIQHYKKKTDVMSSKYSTCIDFQVALFNKAVAALPKGTQVARVGSDAKAKLGGIKGAWYDGSEIDQYDPEPGDIYIFYFPADYHIKEKAGQFSHLGFIKSVGPVGADGMQPWVTVDAGQGTAGVLKVKSATPKVDGAGNPVLNPKTNEQIVDYTFETVVKGAESIKARLRTFDTKKKLMYGGENEDKDARVLYGWVDIDQLPKLPETKK